jgi:hypothetical protein
MSFGYGQSGQNSGSYSESSIISTCAITAITVNDAGFGAVLAADSYSFVNRNAGVALAGVCTVGEDNRVAIGGGING